MTKSISCHCFTRAKLGIARVMKKVDEEDKTHPTSTSIKRDEEPEEERDCGDS